MPDPENLQAPQDGDAKKLHAAMLGRDADGNRYTSPDGLFARNLHTVAAEIGWTPERVSAAMQELVAQDLVLPDHDDGRADRIAASRWIVLDADAGHVERYPDDDAEASEVKAFDDMDADELRAFADANGIDLGKSTSEAGIRAKIDARLGAEAGTEDGGEA